MWVDPKYQSLGMFEPNVGSIVDNLSDLRGYLSEIQDLPEYEKVVTESHLKKLYNARKSQSNDKNKVNPIKLEKKLKKI
jgi:glutathionyl-hydroquinone reductase